MRNCTIIKHQYHTKQKLKNFYMQNWFFLWLIIIITLAGFVFGVVSVYKYADSITTKNMLDAKFMEFLNKSCTSLSLCMSYFVKYIFYIVLFILLCSTKVTFWISCVIMAYFGFCMGVNSSIIIIVFKFQGILHILLCYFPCFLIETIILATVFCTLILRLNCSCRLYNRWYLAFDKEFIKEMIFFIILGFVLFFIQSLINSLTTSTIIVVI